MRISETERAKFRGMWYTHNKVQITVYGEKSMSIKLRNMTSIYIFKGDRVLLLYRQGGKVVNNLWTGSAGGHFEENELNDPESCVLREMKEELNIDKTNIKKINLRYVTLRYYKGEIRQNYYYFADLKNDYSKEISSNEGIIKWFHSTDIRDLEMPYTAKYIIEHYLTIGKDTNGVYVGVADGSKVQFVTMPEYLQ